MYLINKFKRSITKPITQEILNVKGINIKSHYRIFINDISIKSILIMFIIDYNNGMIHGKFKILGDLLIMTELDNSSVRKLRIGHSYTVAPKCHTLLKVKNNNVIYHYTKFSVLIDAFIYMRDRCIMYKADPYINEERIYKYRRSNEMNEVIIDDDTINKPFYSNVYYKITK